MDSITHAVLGATTGYLIAGKSLGQRAVWMGAAAQTFPDIDIVASLFLSPANNLMVHRGITHSIAFNMFITLALGILCYKTFNKNNTRLSVWLLLIGTQVTLHLVLDLCNAYGVGLLEPFSHEKFALHLLFVADPFITLWPLIACVVILISKSATRKQRWAHFAWVAPLIYIGIALLNKGTISRRIDNWTMTHKLAHSDVLITPTPLNTLLWFIAVKTDDGYYIIHRSVFDGENAINANYFPQHHSLMLPMKANEELPVLLDFADDYYALTENEGDVYFNILRFGQPLGWRDAESPFAVRYNLSEPEDNLLMMQRGRFEGWDTRTVKAFVQRTLGHR